MLTYPWKCTDLHCNHLGNTWKPLMLMTRHFDYCPSVSEGDNQSVGSSAPVVSRCFPGGYNVKLYISRGRLAWWLLVFCKLLGLIIYNIIGQCTCILVLNLTWDTRETQLGNNTKHINTPFSHFYVPFMCPSTLASHIKHYTAYNMTCSFMVLNHIINKYSR